MNNEPENDEKQNVKMKLFSIILLLFLLVK